MRQQGEKPRFTGKEPDVLFHTTVPFAWRYHLMRSVSHKWVERQGSRFYITSKPWNSFWGGEGWEKSQNLEVTKLVLTHGGLGRF